MKTFQIEVRETLSRVLDVEANSSEDALEIVKKKYEKCEVVLDADDFSDYDIIPHYD